jgi:hypothetical protein
MALTYKYAVKYNGKYYPPNTPIVEVEPTIPILESNHVIDGTNDNVEPKNDKVKPKRGKVKKDG